MEKMEAVRNRLREIIEEEGIEYLENKPNKVYQDLMEKDLDPVCARLVLSALTAQGAKKALELNEESLSHYFGMECGLRKEEADRLAAMFKELFNQRGLKRREYGFREFCEASWEFHYSGERLWRRRRGNYECSYVIEAAIQVCDQALAHKAVAGFLKKNPFATSDEICNRFCKKLTAKLNGDLKLFISEESFGPPEMDNYDGEYVLKVLCERFGLEVLSCDCEGYVSGPDISTPDDYFYDPDTFDPDEDDWEW